MTKMLLKMIAIMTVLFMLGALLVACAPDGDTDGAQSTEPTSESGSEHKEEETTGGGFNWDKDPSEYDPNKPNDSKPVQKPEDPSDPEDPKDPEGPTEPDEGTELPGEDPKNEPDDDVSDDTLGEPEKPVDPEDPDTPDTPDTPTYPESGEIKDDVADDPFEN